MSPDFATALPFIAIAAILLVLALILLAKAGKRTNVVDRSAARDVLDEGAERAKRNQALIDAPKAVENNFGKTSAVANSDTIATAGARADAESGASITPTTGEVAGKDGQAAPKLASQARAAMTAPSPVPSPGAADDLTQIKGVGPKLVAMLAQQGVTSFAQIADWSAEDIATIDSQLGRFKGRITRDQWVEQAKLLAAGDRAAFVEKFGRNG